MLHAIRKQYAALPYRFFEDRGLQVMLITSRGTGRWIVPKGWPMAGLKPWRAAAREAYEEAGIVGDVEKQPAGRYDYEKRLNDGTVATCEVEVFPLRVEEELPHWPEEQQRTRRWFSPQEASDLVDEGGLRALLASLNAANNGETLAASGEPVAPAERNARCGTPLRTFLPDLIAKLRGRGSSGRSN